jgi:hypothetical protein
VGSMVNLGFPTTRVDDRKVRQWAQLDVDLQAEDSIWNDGGTHANVTRQWAELAFWFPALSEAAGTRPLGMPGVHDEDFGEYGRDDSAFDPTAAAQVLSHGYMVGRSFPDVWGGYVRLRDVMKPQP